MSWKPARPEIEETGLLTADGQKLMRVHRPAKIRFGFDIHLLKPRADAERETYDAFYCPENMLDEVLGDPSEYDPGGDPPENADEVEDDNLCSGWEQEQGGYYTWSDDVDFPPGDYESGDPYEPDDWDEDDDEEDHA